MTATPPPNDTGRHAAEPSIGQLVGEVTGSLQTIIHSEVELAKLELSSSLKNARAGVGFFGAAVVLLVFSLTFGLIALAEGLVAAGIWRWAAYLIVFGFLLLLIATFVVLGIRKVKRIRVVPQRAVATSKDTISYLKANTSSSTSPRA